MEKEDVIFDLERISDLPDLIQGKIIAKKNKASISKLAEKILLLFEIKKELSLDEIMVGLYRKFKVEVTRQSIYGQMRHLKHKDFILKNEADNWEIK